MEITLLFPRLIYWFIVDHARSFFERFVRSLLGDAECIIRQLKCEPRLMKLDIERCRSVTGKEDYTTPNSTMLSREQKNQKR